MQPSVLPGLRIGLVSLCLVGLIQASAGTPRSEEQQLLGMQVPLPPSPVIVEGSPRLVHELHLTNFAQKPLILDHVQVFNGQDSTLIIDFGKDDLKRRLKQIGTSSGNRPLSIAPGMRGVVYIEMTLNEGVIPQLIEHHIKFYVAGKARQQSSKVVRGARISVQSEPPVVLGPLLSGGRWVAIYNPFWERGHRRVLYSVDGRARIPGRYAIDFMKVNVDGRLADGDKDKVSNWYGYGADVLAVANGMIVAVNRSYPESATISGHTNPPPQEAAGNYIVLDLGQGRYAFYEHLKPGSIRVEPGEYVKRGQVIASLGFTGQTTGPHLHFHIASTTSSLGAEGLPFVFENFTVLGSYNDFSQFGEALWIPLDNSDKAQRLGERPAPFVVVDFGTEKL